MARFPKLSMLSLIQFVVALVMFPLFFYWATWLAAEPRSQAVQNSELSIPKDWENVVIGGGQATEWHRGTVQQEPITFGVLTGILVACVLFLIISSVFAPKADDTANRPTDTYGQELAEIATEFERLHLAASLRGTDAGRFLYLERGSRAVELSRFAIEEWWLELWEGKEVAAEHFCSTSQQAIQIARDWLTGEATGNA